MALTIYIERSEGGIGDSAFSPLTNFADPGGAFSYQDADVTPGRLYLYRARRLDSETGLYSDWSPVAIARAPYPNCQGEAPMIDTCDVTTGSDEALGIGLEPFEGVPVAADWMLGLVNGGMGRQHGKRYSRVKRASQTMRRRVVLGQVVYEGTFEVEVTPEAFPVLMLAAMAVETDALADPVRYRHEFKNSKSCRAVTLHHKFGDVYKVYPGSKVFSLTIAPDLEGEDVLIATVGLRAKAELLFRLADTPTVETVLGLDTAPEDTLYAYAPEDGAVYLNGLVGEIRTASFEFARDLGRYKVYDNTHGARGHVSRVGDPSATLTAYFGGPESLKALWRDFGHEADPAAPFGLTKEDGVVTVPVEMVFTPPDNAGGFANEMRLRYPAADVSTSEAAQDRNEAEQTLTVVPIDAEGNADGTDFVLSFVSSVDSATLLTPGSVLDPADVPLTLACKFLYSPAEAGATTTAHAADAANPHLSATDDAYVGRLLRYVTGALAGEERAITDYVGATKTFTTAAFGSAPATGDVFVIL